MGARTARGADYANAYCGIFVVADGRVTSVREYLHSGYAARVLFEPASASEEIASLPLSAALTRPGCAR